MATHNASNERIKRGYFIFLKEAKRQSEDSVDAVAKALARFEAATRYRDFKAFHFEQAVAFKKQLAEQRPVRNGIAEYLAGGLKCALGQIVDAPCLDCFEHGNQFRSLNLGHRARPDVREHVCLETSHHLPRRCPRTC